MANNKTNIKKEENKTSDISKSKAKREQRKQEIAKEKRHRRNVKIAGIAVAVAIIAIIAVSAGQSIYLAAMRTTSDPDFSAGLTTDGKIDGVNVRDALNLVDYANISVPADEVAADSEEVEENINSTLTSHKAPSTDGTLAIKDGDTVNIDFVGTVDGVEFEGGSSNGEGYNLTIGSGSFIDDFEQQLIGHHPGENISVEVTFPENYSNNPDLANKDAEFAVTINSITVTPELTDDFVAANFTEEGLSTVEEYRASVENRYYEQHLQEYLTSYIIDNSTVTTYPSAYLKKLRAVTKYDDEYALQFYASYGMSGYENLWDLRGEDITDELSYEMDLRERAKEIAKEAMVYQAIFEDAGLTVDMDTATAEMTEEYGEEYVTNMKEHYGEGYMAQNEIRQTVIDYLMELYK